MFTPLPDIDKEFVLSRVSQEEIFERYLGQTVVSGGSYYSPLRDDKRPTCSIKKLQTGKLLFNDWTGHFKGDCFDLVGRMYGCNYYDVCKIIAEEFGLIDGTSEGKFIKRTPAEIKYEAQSAAVIKVQWRDFNKSDKLYWSTYGISMLTLKVFNVGAIKYTWVNDELRYVEQPGDPGYAYWFDNDNIKAYFPLRESFRFIGNTQVLQGYAQLPKTGSVLIVTKSMKDVMFFYQMGLPSVAPQSESVGLTADQHSELSSRFDRIIYIYDYDEHGVRTLDKVKTEYPDIHVKFFTDGTDNTHDYGGKDVTDIVKNKSLKAAIDSTFLLLAGIDAGLDQIIQKLNKVIKSKITKKIKKI